MRRTDQLIDNHRLLDELAELAAELAGAAASLFRFGASRAYNEIVQMRLQISARQGRRLSLVVPGAPHGAGGAHLHHHRRAATTLSQKLARAPSVAHARRRRQAANRDLLKSMNERTRLQLPQTTVEGLSVAAVSQPWSGCSAIW